MIELILPMFVLVILTVIIGVSLAVAGFSNVSRKKIRPSYFRIMQGDTPPESMVRLSRNFSNLFEVPVFFYVVCTLALALNIQSQSFLFLAWAFVILRIFHSLIHVTYNHPLHRGLVFLISLAVVVAMWVTVLLIVADRVNV